MDYQNIFKAGTGKSVADMYADFQGAFTELAQIYKSTTEPSPTYACQWWADETSGLLKQRNADNTAWIVRGYLDKPFFGLVPYVDNGAVSPLLTGRNRLINGNFDPKIGWQRGTSFALGSGETKFTADRYRCTQGTGGVGTVSMQSVTPAAVPGARRRAAGAALKADEEGRGRARPARRDGRAAHLAKFWPGHGDGPRRVWPPGRHRHPRGPAHGDGRPIRQSSG